MPWGKFSPLEDCPVIHSLFMVPRTVDTDYKATRNSEDIGKHQAFTDDILFIIFLLQII